MRRPRRSSVRQTGKRSLAGLFEELNRTHFGGRLPAYRVRRTHFGVSFAAFVLDDRRPDVLGRCHPRLHEIWLYHRLTPRE